MYEKCGTSIDLCSSFDALQDQDSQQDTRTSSGVRAMERSTHCSMQPGFSRFPSRVPYGGWTLILDRSKKEFGVLQYQIDLLGQLLQGLFSAVPDRYIAPIHLLVGQRVCTRGSRRSMRCVSSDATRLVQTRADPTQYLFSLLHT